MLRVLMYFLKACEQNAVRNTYSGSIRMISGCLACSYLNIVWTSCTTRIPFFTGIYKSRSIIEIGLHTVFLSVCHGRAVVKVCRARSIASCPLIANEQH